MPLTQVVVIHLSGHSLWTLPHDNSVAQTCRSCRLLVSSVAVKSGLVLEPAETRVVYYQASRTTVKRRHRRQRYTTTRRLLHLCQLRVTCHMLDSNMSPVKFMPTAHAMKLTLIQHELTFARHTIVVQDGKVSNTPNLLVNRCNLFVRWNLTALEQKLNCVCRLSTRLRYVVTSLSQSLQLPVTYER